MNKRQAKKEFKKKYGMNPNQVAKAISEFDWSGFANKVIDVLSNAISQFNEFVKENPEVIEEIIEKKLREEYKDEC